MIYCKLNIDFGLQYGGEQNENNIPHQEQYKDAGPCRAVCRSYRCGSLSEVSAGSDAGDAAILFYRPGRGAAGTQVGFLLGLIPAALVAGLIAGRKGGHLLWVALAGAAALGVLYLVGLPYMYLIFTAYLGRTTTVSGLVKAGMLVYLPGDAIKIVVLSLLAKPLSRALSRAQA